MTEKRMEPELHNEELEAAIQEFKKDQTKENMIKVLQLLEKTMVLQPAVFPPEKKDEIMERIKQGQKGAPMQLGPEMQPRPMILKNDKGERFFAVYTGKAQIPANQKFPAVLYVPFKECSKMAARKELQLMGVVLNPQTDNLTLHIAALELMNQRTEGRKVTPMSFGDLMMQKGLPERFHQDRPGFMQRIAQEKEDYITGVFLEGYQKMQDQKGSCPYQKEDFEILLLNISDTVQMVRIGLSETAAKKGQYISAFCFYNPVTEDGIYYLIGRGPKGSPNLLFSVDEKGSCSALGEAPAEGSELYELIGRVPWEKENA